jgi:hypothetical protein
MPGASTSPPQNGLHGRRRLGHVVRHAHILAPQHCRGDG